MINTQDCSQKDIDIVAVEDESVEKESGIYTPKPVVSSMTTDDLDTIIRIARDHEPISNIFLTKIRVE